MAERKTAPYGSWASPISPAMVVSAARGFSGIVLSGETIYYGESRPNEGGRIVVVRRDASGATRDITPPGYNVRTRVHEYGGISFTVDGETVYFSNFSDQ